MSQKQIMPAMQLSLWLYHQYSITHVAYDAPAILWLSIHNDYAIQATAVLRLNIYNDYCNSF